jgi:tRNA A37 methylthiotransferase MiaB
LKVQDGCDYFCTYCTIPFARGRSRNPKIEELVALLTDDERKIYKELMDKAVARLAKQKKIDELERMRKEIAELEASINSMN